MNLIPIEMRTVDCNYYYLKKNTLKHTSYYIHMYMCNSHKYIRENYRFLIAHYVSNKKNYDITLFWLAQQKKKGKVDGRKMKHVGYGGQRLVAIQWFGRMVGGERDRKLGNRDWKLETSQRRRKGNSEGLNNGGKSKRKKVNYKVGWKEGEERK